MLYFLTHLFDTSGFPARWHCGSWTSAHGWLHIISDLGIWSAYLAIPCVLGYFVVRKKHIPFRMIFLLFGAFILACGTTHLMEALIFWWPAYRLAGVIKLITAIVSWGTVLALIPATPKVLAMRSPEELEREIATRKEVEAALQRVNAELQDRIRELQAEATARRASEEHVETISRHEAQLREKLREIDTLMDVVPVAIVTTYDPTCRTITGNRAASELLQVPLHGNLSMSAPVEEQPPFRVFRHGNEAPPHELPIQVAAAKGIDVRNDEQELRFDDGTVRHIICHASPLFDDHGAVRGCVGAVLDVSKQKETEELLKEADRRKDEFLATLAHELRNPLTPISNALQAWPRVAHDRAEMEDLRGIMERQVRQMIRLIDDLLDVSRIGKGKVQLRKQQADLGTIISSAVEAIQPIMESSGHQLEVSMATKPIVVNVDVARLTQIFVNVLHNAAKYTGKKGRIRISVESVADHAVITIKDNGAGIPKHMLSRIFDPFQQVDQTLNRSHGGLGIGLTLVKRLLELHGGSVEAHSDGPGTGSEFVVTIPISADSEIADESALHHTIRLVPGLPSFRILIVDDVAASVKTLAMMLRAIGQDVRMLDDGAAAIEWVTAHKPHVVFLDIAMPGMDGYEVARRIRAQPGTKDIFLVALTGYGQDDDRRQAMEAGFNLHLTKPTSMDVLQQLLFTLPEPNGGMNPGGSET